MEGYGPSSKIYRKFFLFWRIILQFRHKSIYKKIPFDGIVFELKNLSYIKAFFSKATSEVTKTVLVLIIKQYVKV